jgi:hypothetical protein
MAAMETPGRDLARVLEFTEAAAFADMLRAAPAAWRASDERSALGWRLQMPVADLLLFNRLIGCGLDAPVDRARLRECLQQARDLELKSFGVQPSPAAEPAALRSWLDAEGFVVRDRWTKAYRDALAPPPVATSLRIERATSAHAADVVGRVTCASFGMPDIRRLWIASFVGRPGWSHYLAWDADEPVAVAALFVMGDAGWLGMTGTLPESRRKGAQAALIARRLADGAAAGCRWFVTETDEDTPARPNPSFRNMIRAGFRVAYQRENFLRARLTV